ncbi:MAG: phosphoesterase [Pirellulales bacterium]|nr:phosphoesterase [Pirellulales bacterium]
MSTVTQERVLVVPTSEFHALGHFQGFTGDIDTYLPALLESRQLSYRPRGEMEQNPDFKQLIPYVLFRFNESGASPQLFQYTRGGGQGEARLHAKRSVGIGGHISSEDSAAGTAHDVYCEGMQRELTEEVIIDTQFSQRCVGLINDDETPVGKVHLGIVHLYEVLTPQVHPREVDIKNAGFQPIEEIVAELDQFESWSQIVVPALFA